LKDISPGSPENPLCEGDQLLDSDGPQPRHYPDHCRQKEKAQMLRPAETSEPAPHPTDIAAGTGELPLNLILSRHRPGRSVGRCEWAGED
jgi:hypothetical protein